MRKLTCLVVILSAFVLGTSLAAAQDSPAFEPASCGFNRPGGFTIECGYITVPESRDPALADDTNELQLAVAIFRSYTAEPDTAPLIYLDGGPGGQTLSTVEYLAGLFQPFLQNRDVIFFDQRGVGLSQAIDCPAYTDLSYDVLGQDLDFDELVQLANDTLLACRDDAIAAGANLSAYTSAENAADVRDIVTALGYEQADLLGVSYGTRLALTVMRDYPEVVRSVILDAVLPLQANPDSEFLINAQRAFTTLFEGCAKDAACDQLYPDLETVFYDTVQQVNEQPEVVSTFDYFTGQPRDVLINGDTLISGLFGLMYQTGEIANLPRYIYEAADGVYDGFVDDLLYTVFQGDYFDEVMFTAVGCNEETPFDTYEAAMASSEGLPEPLTEIFLAQIESSFTLCDAWGGLQPGAIENEPVVSDIPTLITVGEYDPITPPRWARLTAETLSNSYLYEFPGIGHATFAASNCAIGMMAAFVHDPTTAPDSSCIENVPPPLFAVAEITAINNRPYTSDDLGFSSVVPEGWYQIEPGLLSPYPEMEPTAIPVIAFRFPITLDDYVRQIITGGFYAYDELPPSAATVRANGRDWNIYQVERPDQDVYTSFAFFEGDRTYVIGVTATTETERDYLYNALLIPAVEAFEIVE